MSISLYAAVRPRHRRLAGDASRPVSAFLVRARRGRKLHLRRWWEGAKGAGADVGLCPGLRQTVSSGAHVDERLATSNQSTRSFISFKQIIQMGRIRPDPLSCLRTFHCVPQRCPLRHWRKRRRQVSVLLVLKCVSLVFSFNSVCH